MLLLSKGNKPLFQNVHNFQFSRLLQFLPFFANSKLAIFCLYDYHPYCIHITTKVYMKNQGNKSKVGLEFFLPIVVFLSLWIFNIRYFRLVTGPIRTESNYRSSSWWWKKTPHSTPVKSNAYLVYSYVLQICLILLFFKRISSHRIFQFLFEDFIFKIAKKIHI